MSSSKSSLRFAFVERVSIELHRWSWKIMEGHDMEGLILVIVIRLRDAVKIVIFSDIVILNIFVNNWVHKRFCASLCTVYCLDWSWSLTRYIFPLGAPQCPAAWGWAGVGGVGVVATRWAVIGQLVTYWSLIGQAGGVWTGWAPTWPGPATRERGGRTPGTWSPAGRGRPGRSAKSSFSNLLQSGDGMTEIFIKIVFLWININIKCL